MGYNNIQGLAEAICLHVSTLMWLASIMGSFNEQYTKKREPVNSIKIL